MDFEQARRAIKEVSRREGKSEKEVRSQIDAAIRELYDNPERREAFKPLFRDSPPGAEEFILYLAGLVSSQKDLLH